MDQNFISLSPEQIAVIENPLDAKVFLQGPAGSGKTTAGVERLLYLLAQGVPGDSILLLVPQRTLASVYLAALRTPRAAAGGLVSMVTLGGLARRMVELFWPLVVEQAGFAHPDQSPTFLTLETAQYYMAHLLRPKLDEGLFSSVTLDRNRLYSQILDNLNKSAVIGFPHTQVGERLKGAWVGEPGQLHVFEDVQFSANLFRQYCLEHNLLDFSLQVEIFWQHLWPMQLCREYLQRTYRHLVVDNLEEDTPVTHDLLREWLPAFDSALAIYDQQAGYRRFLGADPQTANALKDLFPFQFSFQHSYVTSPDVQALERGLGEVLYHATNTAEHQPERAAGEENGGSARAALAYDVQRFYPEMLDWVAAQIDRLVNQQGVPPGEIVVLAPFLSDALRFSLANRLEAYEIPTRSHRPSRSLREEPATECLLTLSALAHPDWGIVPPKPDVAYALVQAIQGLDLVRAQLLVDIVYRLRAGAPVLNSYEDLLPEVQERITYRLGERYEGLRNWLERYRQDPAEEFDHFLSRLFGELLSQPGYGFHANYDAGEVSANLIESVQKFRWVTDEALAEGGIPLGKEYLLMVQEGVIAAQYILSWQVQPEDAVLLAPAYTFLLSNRPVDYQFWLDVGSRGWFERLYQPLTHPYVLSRSWPQNKVWSDVDEIETNQETLYRLALGLIRRCRVGLLLGLSELNEQGYEQRGPLLHAFQRMLQRTNQDGS
jgi:hypothetical protein